MGLYIDVQNDLFPEQIYVYPLTYSQAFILFSFSVGIFFLMYKHYGNNTDNWNCPLQLHKVNQIRK